MCSGEKDNNTPVSECSGREGNNTPISRCSSEEGITTSLLNSMNSSTINFLGTVVRRFTVYCTCDWL